MVMKIVQQAKQREMEPEKAQRMNKIAFQTQSKADHPRTTYMLFAPVTLTLTRWPWSTNLTWRFWRCRLLAYTKINFSGQCFQKLDHIRHTRRHTNKRTYKYNRTLYYATFARVVNIWAVCATIRKNRHHLWKRWSSHKVKLFVSLWWSTSLKDDDVILTGDAPNEQSPSVDSKGAGSGVISIGAMQENLQMVATGARPRPLTSMSINCSRIDCSKACKR